MSHRHLVRRRTLLGQGAGLLLGAGLAGTARAQAPAPQGIELTTLRAHRAEGVLSLDFVARVVLPRAVEEALTRGVPVVFLAEATLLRSRWYWRDARVARVSRRWRVAFQPLTGNWRVGLGGLNQSHATLEEALIAASRSAGWHLADLAQLDPDKSYYVEFDYRLDTSQLPSPMQFGLVTQGDWAFGASRVLKVD
ncbi:MAG: DUF4390 domain-containing protein [Rubrivivax sp.]|nr:DUF4390 domain-containing protein [Rubrivivax sp.]